MSGSIFGEHFSISTWGESHGKGLGVVIDGCPAGVEISETMIQEYLNRRKPGQTIYSTPRKEGDEVEILSGVFEGKTTGAPISLMVMNTSQRSHDYSEIAKCYRPGHADYTWNAKYGFRDYRGGGRSSGRETIGRVAAGAIAAKVLAELGISVSAFTKAIGPIECRRDCEPKQAVKSPLWMPDLDASKAAEEYLKGQLERQDSAGGIIECHVDGMPAGVGEPVFRKLNAVLSYAVSSIGAVKGVEIGDGFLCAELSGSENNDTFYASERGIEKHTNHAGGILGGISDGSQVVIRAAIKPTPSIAREQRTVTTEGEDTSICIKGRHDPIIVPRAVVVVESMVAVTILDLMIEGMASKIENMKKVYE